MPEDILEAANNVETPAATIPVEPPPQPMVIPNPDIPPSEQLEAIANPEPTPSPEASKLVESILDSGNQSTVVAPPLPPAKKGISGVLVALFLLIIGGSIGAGSYFISQRHAQVC